MRRVILCLLLALCLSAEAQAAAPGDVFGADNVEAAAPPKAREILGDPDASEIDPDGGLERIFSYLRQHFGEAVKETLRPLASIVALCLLCGMGESFSAGTKAGADIVALGGSLAIAAIGVSDVHSVLGVGTAALAELTDFSRVLLPTLTTAAAASGAAGSAAAAYAASALFSDLLLEASEKLILPAICGYTAAAVCSAVLGDRRLDGAVHFLQWFAKTLLKALVICFTAYLSLTGILAGAADAAAVKAAKTVISTALPVIGKLMADASEALVAGAGLLRGAIGVYGMLVCLAVVLLPALRLGLRCLLFRAAAAVCSGFAGERQARLISCLGTAYGMVLSLIASAGAVQFLAVISLIRTVTL